jgi:hypothetical protein
MTIGSLPENETIYFLKDRFSKSSYYAWQRNAVRRKRKTLISVSKQLVFPIARPFKSPKGENPTHCERGASPLGDLGACEGN